ncbi:Aldo/keto reductase [Lentithecium fluviatile CBS 122367]|uniref:Aldo/keto reductase n=1 Tax=Lentithecium fluviatile CBS 122367 TaxID=1168545 RepID=A0A6G1J5V3_9PLEO|nr:Aldo/keto reductase [Lentithecium fluviatile CBS 122367]
MEEESPAPSVAQSAQPTFLNGDAFPPLVYGSAIRERPKQANIRAAFRKGYRGLDTASSRGLHDEQQDGQALKDLLASRSNSLQLNIKREDIWIQTKFSIALDQSDPWPYDPGDPIALQILKSIQRSLINLGVDVIDVYFLSSQLSTFEETLSAWEVMETLVQRGIVRYLGICHVNADLLRRLLGRVTTKPAFVQNEFVLDDGCDSHVRSICKAQGIAYQVFGLFWKHNSGLLSLAPVQQLARSFDFTAQVALLVLILASAADEGLRLSILDGTMDEHHMEMNLQCPKAFHSVQNPLIDQFRLISGF